MDRLTRHHRDGLVFETTDSGPAEGEVIVLLHGFPATRASWRDVVPRLEAAGLRCLVPLQRGYSPGARPRGRRAYRSTELVADVVALLDEAGVDRAHVVGHDWGGAVAWKLAAEHPDRVASLTVLSTPHPAALAASLTSSLQALRSWYMVAFQLPWLPEALLRRRLASVLRGTGLPAERAEEYAGAMRDSRALTGAIAWYRALWLPGGGARPSLATGRVTVPTRYLWGRHDTALGRRAAELTTRHVSGPYRFVELDEGHWLPEVAPRVVAQAVLDAVRAI
ncbi:pimeloyl-ACP methyl ester carboxylesterase [Frigoribacterium sp. PvP120]|uniref:alpha/beta fold hydrolase n=1 Tax=unclassified Frigoribacterium TaxID=2627005 RepID=UPI001AE90E96|nr:alpha/beta fold hydrolase [Frigoribacterium sp. PvP121]MBP1239717.1 pimeloyl-ACP methyl ester carboxylesterase [Frigoribacterium sp. PvP121]